MITAIDGYPFHLMTERYGFTARDPQRTGRSFLDAFQEYYHVPALHAHQQVPAKRALVARGVRGRRTSRLDGPHRVVSTAGVPRHTWPVESLYPSEPATRSGLLGPWDEPEIGPVPAVSTRATSEPWGITNFQVFPNLEILIYERGWYLTYHVLADVAQHAPVRGRPLLRAGEERARARGARESPRSRSRSTRSRTRARSRARSRCSSRGVLSEFPMCDQELLVRHFHKAVGDWVDDYRASAGSSGGLSRCCPTSSRTSSAFAATWCLATEAERYAQRMASSMEELQEFYDACFPRLEDAIAYCDKFPLDDMPDDVVRLLQLVYSLLMVSFAVEVWFDQKPLNSAGALPRPCHRAHAVTTPSPALPESEV